MRFKLNRRSFTAFTAILALTSFVSHPALAEYPEKPLTMIIGFKAGGGTDLTGRALAAALSKEIGKPIAVVNQPARQA